VTRHLCT